MLCHFYSGNVLPRKLPQVTTILSYYKIFFALQHPSLLSEPARKSLILKGMPTGLEEWPSPQSFGIIAFSQELPPKSPNGSNGWSKTYGAADATQSEIAAFDPIKTGKTTLAL